MSDADPVAERVHGLVLALAGADITAYKDNLLLRRVRAMARQGEFPDLDSYLDYLAAGGQRAAAQARQLVQNLSVSVSGFFRDPGVFRALEDEVFPQLYAGSRAKTLRVWSAACAHGQEAYSLAISLWRYSRARGVGGRMAVLGTDVDEAALNHARHATYSRKSLEGVPPGVLEEAFVPESGNTLRVRPEIRSMVRFQRADLLDPGSHPQEIDLITCRNLLIYLRRAVQEEVILALRRALRPGGYLVLGASETVLGRPWAELEHVNPARRIYRRPTPQ